MSEEGQEPIANSQEPDGTADVNNETFDAEYVKKLRAEAAAHRVRVRELEAAEQERTKAQQAEAEKRMAEQQKFQELAEKRAAERDDATKQAETLQERVTRQEEALQALYDGRKEAVPEMYRPLLEKLDLVERLEWIAANEDVLTTAKAKPNGIPATPAARGKGELSPEERRRRAARTF